MKCDKCDKEAVVNYQKVWIRWKIVNGEYIRDKSFDSLDFEQPIERDNLHFCKEHEKEFLEE